MFNALEGKIEIVAINLIAFVEKKLSLGGWIKVFKAVIYTSLMMRTV